MANFDNLPTRYYSQEEVQEILKLAIARQTDDNNREFTYQQLQEIALDLDIPVDTLQVAEKDWQNKQGEIQQRLVFDSFLRSRFKKRVGNYAIVNGVIVLLDLLTGGGISWSIYIILFWGMFVSLDAWNTFQMKGEDYEAAFQSWNRKYQIKRSFNNLVNKFLKATSA